MANEMNAIILEGIMFWTMCICISLFVIEKVSEKYLTPFQKTDRLIPLSVFQYHGNNFLYDLQEPMMAVVFPMITLAVFFYLGQEFNSNSLNLSVEIYQSEWYQYPRSVQRFVVLMMMRSQQPFHLNAYGIEFEKLRRCKYLNHLG